MAEVVRSAEDIEAELNEATANGIEGNRFPGMKYDDGVKDALAWVLGERDEAPSEE